MRERAKDLLSRRSLTSRSMKPAKQFPMRKWPNYESRDAPFMANGITRLRPEAPSKVVHIIMHSLLSASVVPTESRRTEKRRNPGSREGRRPRTGIDAGRHELPH